MAAEYRMAKLEDVPALRELWKEAFGDSDAFLDQFFGTAFSTRRCHVMAEGEDIQSVVYLLDCSCGGQQMAYVYAVATKAACRGQGLCNTLMDRVHRELEAQGFAATILVPGTRELVRFYAKMGYVPCAPRGKIRATASGPATILKAVSPRRYGELRRDLLPPGAVLQEGVSLDFLATQARLYAGKDLLLAATVLPDGTLLGQELLCRDPIAMAPKILKALRVQEGIFRIPWPNGRPFALFRPLEKWEGEKPGYLGFAFD
ncbi:MAG: GNAT family N-acetyltransferase [Ruminococcaceae bacterium]|nr:GNAT family N-acetyltransferase [Oscillospiraceae bacterium]